MLTKLINIISALGGSVGAQLTVCLSLSAVITAINVYLKGSITPLQFVCYILMSWFVISLLTTLVEYLNGQITWQQLFFYQFINLVSYFLFYYGSQVQTTPLFSQMILIGFFLVGWYFRIMFLDYNNPVFTPGQRWFYTLIDFSAFLTASWINYTNIFTTIRVTEVSTKLDVISSLEKLLKFGYILIG